MWGQYPTSDASANRERKDSCGPLEDVHPSL